MRTSGTHAGPNPTQPTSEDCPKPLRDGPKPLPRTKFPLTTTTVDSQGPASLNSVPPSHTERCLSAEPPPKPPRAKDLRLARQSAHPSTHPSVNPSAHSSVNPSAHSSANSSVNPSVNPSAHSLAHPSTNSSVNPSVNPSANPSAHSSAHPSVNLSAHPSFRLGNPPSSPARTSPRVSSVCSVDEFEDACRDVFRNTTKAKDMSSVGKHVQAVSHYQSALTSVDQVLHAQVLSLSPHEPTRQRLFLQQQEVFTLRKELLNGFSDAQAAVRIPPGLSPTADLPPGAPPSYDDVLQEDRQQGRNLKDESRQTDNHSPITTPSIQSHQRRTRTPRTNPHTLHTPARTHSTHTTPLTPRSGGGGGGSILAASSNNNNNNTEKPIGAKPKSYNNPFTKPNNIPPPPSLPPPIPPTHPTTTTAIYKPDNDRLLHVNKTGSCGDGGSRTAHSHTQAKNIHSSSPKRNTHSHNKSIIKSVSEMSKGENIREIDTVLIEDPFLTTDPFPLTTKRESEYSSGSHSSKHHTNMPILNHSFLNTNQTHNSPSATTNKLETSILDALDFATTPVMQRRVPAQYEFKGTTRSEENLLDVSRNTLEAILRFSGEAERVKHASIIEEFDPLICVEDRNVQSDLTERNINVQSDNKTTHAQTDNVSDKNGRSQIIQSSSHKNTQARNYSSFDKNARTQTKKYSTSDKGTDTPTRQKADDSSRFDYQVEGAVALADEGGRGTANQCTTQTESEEPIYMNQQTTQYNQAHTHIKGEAFGSVNKEENAKAEKHTHQTNYTDVTKTDEPIYANQENTQLEGNHTPSHIEVDTSHSHFTPTQDYNNAIYSLPPPPPYDTSVSSLHPYLQDEDDQPHSIDVGRSAFYLPPMPQSEVKRKSLLTIREGVKIYFIYRDNVVTSTFNKPVLTVYKDPSEEHQDLFGSGVVVGVGNTVWECHLHKKATLVLRTHTGYYLFNHVGRRQNCKAVAIRVPSRVRRSQQELLSGILQQHSMMEEERPKGITKAISKGASSAAFRVNKFVEEESVSSGLTFMRRNSMRALKGVRRRLTSIAERTGATLEDLPEEYKVLQEAADSLTFALNAKMIQYF